RDFHVTGVQTCALPIWATGHRSPPSRSWLVRREVTVRGQRDCVASARRAAAALVLLASALTACSSSPEPQAEPWVPRAPAAAERSEERRAGKEERSRW